MNRRFLLTGLILIILAIVLGAFGAHGLEGKIPAKKIASFETGVKYQMYHGLGMLLLASLSTKFSFSFRSVYVLMLLGVVFFSFSIYFLSLQPIIGGAYNKVLGPITPIGGLLLIVSWTVLFFKILKNKTDE